jgi:hypothetical protein
MLDVKGKTDVPLACCWSTNGAHLGVPNSQNKRIFPFLVFLFFFDQKPAVIRYFCRLAAGCYL